ncbi:MAG: class I SAM-dependent methyltransferase [Polyangiaceae bacterium]
MLGRIWRREHDALNAEVVEHLEVCDGHFVLAIGSGPGEGLAGIAQCIGSGKVVGVDVSELMAKVARRRNWQGVAGGGVEARVGDVTAMELGESTFDRVFSVHCIYFWRDVDAVLTKLGEALRPSGKLILAFRPESDGIPARFRDPTYRFPRVEQVTASLQRVGLQVEPVTNSVASPTAVLVSAVRR